MPPAFRFEDIPADPRDLAPDCDITFARGSGPGGQHRNTTETAVRVVHRPTGVVATASEERSQSRNRERALERLREKLLRRLKPRKPRRRTAPPRAARETRLRRKKQAGLKKAMRRIPRDQE